jgi:hypothetical protein
MALRTENREGTTAVWHGSSFTESANEAAGPDAEVSAGSESQSRIAILDGSGAAVKLGSRLERDARLLDDIDIAQGIRRERRAGT